MSEHFFSEHGDDLVAEFDLTIDNKSRKDNTRKLQILEVVTHSKTSKLPASSEYGTNPSKSFVNHQTKTLPARKQFHKQASAPELWNRTLSGSCHIQDCLGHGYYTCSAHFFCREFGCQRSMCNKHRVKRKCLLSDYRKGSCHPEVCIACDSHITGLSRTAMVAPICVYIICVAFIVAAVIVFP